MLLLLLTWSHNKQLQISNKSAVTLQLWRMRTAGSITHGCMNCYSLQGTPTPLRETHMQQSKEMTAVSARQAQMSFCRDAEIQATGRNSAALSHTRIPKAMLSPASDKPDAAFLPLKWIWSKKYWRSHLGRHAGCDVSCSGRAQAPRRDEMREECASDMHTCIFRQVSCFCSLPRGKPGLWMSVDSGFQGQCTISQTGNKMPHWAYTCLHHGFVYFN